MTEQRFLLNSRASNTSDDPGLVLEDDGLVYQIFPDGSRAAIGSGGADAGTPVRVHPAIVEDQDPTYTVVGSRETLLSAALIADGTDYTGSGSAVSLEIVDDEGFLVLTSITGGGFTAGIVNWFSWFEGAVGSVNSQDGVYQNSYPIPTIPLLPGWKVIFLGCDTPTTLGGVINGCSLYLLRTP